MQMQCRHPFLWSQMYANGICKPRIYMKSIFNSDSHIVGLFMQSECQHHHPGFFKVFLMSAPSPWFLFFKILKWLLLFQIFGCWMRSRPIIYHYIVIYIFANSSSLFMQTEIIFHLLNQLFNLLLWLSKQMPVSWRWNRPGIGTKRDGNDTPFVTHPSTNACTK